MASPHLCVCVHIYKLCMISSDCIFARHVCVCARVVFSSRFYYRHIQTGFDAEQPNLDGHLFRLHYELWSFLISYDTHTTAAKWTAVLYVQRASARSTVPTSKMRYGNAWKTYALTFELKTNCNKVFGTRWEKERRFMFGCSCTQCLTRRRTSVRNRCLCLCVCTGLSLSTRCSTGSCNAMRMGIYLAFHLHNIQIFCLFNDWLKVMRAVCVECRFIWYFFLWNTICAHIKELQQHQQKANICKYLRGFNTIKRMYKH